MEIIDISKINKIRKNKGITIKQLVELSGISYTTLSKICAGYVAKPNTKTLNAIAKALMCLSQSFIRMMIHTTVQSIGLVCCRQKQVML